MRNHGFWGAWALMAGLCGLTAGCEPSEDECEPACDPGLVCQAGQCGTADGGAGGAGGGGGGGEGGDGGGGGLPAGALPEDTFLFVRADGTAISIWAYDTAANREQRVFQLAPGESLVSLDLSPDRRQVAFASNRGLDLTEFPPMSGLPTQSVWLMGLDGSNLRRVMEPLVGPATIACDNDQQCAPQGLVCNPAFRRCQRRNESRHVGSLDFSPDGSRLWFGYSNHWLNDEGRIEGGSTIGSIRTDGSDFALYTNLVDETGCSQINGPAAHPEGRTVAALLTVCGGDGGYHAFDVPPRGAGRPLFQAGTRDNGVTITMEHTRPVWSPDGNVLYFVAVGNWTNPGGLDESDFRYGVIGVDTRNGDAGIVVEAPAGQEITSIAISPRGDKAAVCTRGGQGTNVWLFDSNAGGSLTQLTRDGGSCEVTW